MKPLQITVAAAGAALAWALYQRFKKENDATDSLKTQTNDEILAHVAKALLVVSKRRPDRKDLTSELVHKIEIRAAQLYSAVREDMHVTHGIEPAPASCKAFLRVKQGTNGPCTTPPNPKLKFLLLSSGITKKSSPNILQAYRRLYESSSSAARRGVVYLLDARLEDLQFAHEYCDPAEDGDCDKVAYVRKPDAPGGAPVLGPDGAPRLKTQAELVKIGKATPQYMLRHFGHIAAGTLEVLCPSEDPNEEFPITVAYLWTEVTGGLNEDSDVSAQPGVTAGHNHAHQIFAGVGTYSRANGFVARCADGGAPYTAADYERPMPTPSKQSHFFRAVTDDEWGGIIASHRATYVTGGVPWFGVSAMQPNFVVDGTSRPDMPNAYAREVLDTVKDGELVYTGNSAGACLLSFALGPLTADGTARPVRPGATAHDYGARGELGIKWLYPGIGEYVGMPHRLVFRPHITFDPSTLGYQGRALAASCSLESAASAPQFDVWAVLLADYDFDNAKSDAFEISGGSCHFHVSSCDTACYPLTDEARAELKELGHIACAEGATLVRQPSGVPQDGFSFTWHPNDGEIIGGGPRTNAQHVFRLYADEHGPLMGAPPSFSRGARQHWGIARKNSTHAATAKGKAN